MAEKSLELRAAKARRQYWLEELEAARHAGDVGREARALQFVGEYEQLIAGIERVLDNSMTWTRGQNDA